MASPFIPCFHGATSNVANQPPATAIAIQRLRERYSKLRDTGTLGGSVRLYELEHLAWQAFDIESADRRLVCFVLASVFSRLAQRQESGAVTVDESAKLHSIFDQPIIECLDAVTGRSANADPTQSLTNLVEAYAQLRRNH